MCGEIGNNCIYFIGWVVTLSICVTVLKRDHSPFYFYLTAASAKTYIRYNRFAIFDNFNNT